MTTWSINNIPIAQLGLKLVSGEKRAHGPSSVRLVRTSAFDAAEMFSYGAAVSISYATSGGAAGIFLTGKVVKIPKAGAAAHESQEYVIHDCWAELEKTIYQEPWGIGSGAIMVPRSVLGMDHLGARISVGRQIQNVITYAASTGIAIQCGTVPSGETPIPNEISNVTCAEILTLCLKMHPDWIPWIDHSTSPPSYNVTALADASAVGIALDGSGGVSKLSVTRRDDLLPASVRIVNEWATTIGSEVYRNMSIDKWPADGPDAGPLVLQAHVPLAGMQQQMQKSRVQVRKIPTTKDDLWAKDWLKAHNPALAKIPDDHFIITSISAGLLAEPDFPDPISAQAPRLVPGGISDLPNELVSGGIEDWMRVKTGRALVSATIEAAPGATRAERGIIARSVSNWSGVVTNAETKIYKGVSSWIAAEQLPTGIAQATYEAIHASMPYDGRITLKATDFPTTPYLGRKLNLTGAASDWSAMNAPIHSVSFDIDKGTTTIGFGPVRELAPADFLEMQRILRWRPTHWWSREERTSNKHGALNDPSAKGDTVGAFTHPNSELTSDGAGSPLPFQVRLGITTGSGGAFAAYVTVEDGYVCERCPGPATTDALYYGIPGNLTDDNQLRKKFPIADGQQVSVVVPVKPTGEIDDSSGAGVSIVVEAADPVSVHYVPKAPNADAPTGTAGTYHYKLAVFHAATGSEPAYLENFLAGSHIDHFRDLPLIDNTMGAGGGVGRVFNKYDPSDATYKFRTLKKPASGQVQVTEKTDSSGNAYIELRGTSQDGECGIHINRHGPSTSGTSSVSDGLVTAVGTVANIAIGDDFDIQFQDVTISFDPVTLQPSYNYQNGSSYLYVREGHLYSTPPGWAQGTGTMTQVTVLRSVAISLPNSLVELLNS